MVNSSKSEPNIDQQLKQKIATIKDSMKQLQTHISQFSEYNIDLSNVTKDLQVYKSFLEQYQKDLNTPNVTSLTQKKLAFTQLENIAKNIKTCLAEIDQQVDAKLTKDLLNCRDFIYTLPTYDFLEARGSYKSITEEIHKISYTHTTIKERLQQKQQLLERIDSITVKHKKNETDDAENTLVKATTKEDQHIDWQQLQALSTNTIAFRNIFKNAVSVLEEKVKAFGQVGTTLLIKHKQKLFTELLSAHAKNEKSIIIQYLKDLQTAVTNLTSKEKLETQQEELLTKLENELEQINPALLQAYQKGLILEIERLGTNTSINGDEFIQKIDYLTAEYIKMLQEVLQNESIKELENQLGDINPELLDVCQKAYKKEILSLEQHPTSVDNIDHEKHKIINDYKELLSNAILAEQEELGTTLYEQIHKLDYKILSDLQNSISTINADDYMLLRTIISELEKTFDSQKLESLKQQFITTYKKQLPETWNGSFQLPAMDKLTERYIDVMSSYAIALASELNTNQQAKILQAIFQKELSPIKEIQEPTSQLSESTLSSTAELTQAIQELESVIKTLPTYEFLQALDNYRSITKTLDEIVTEQTTVAQKLEKEQQLTKKILDDTQNYQKYTFNYDNIATPDKLPTTPFDFEKFMQFFKDSVYITEKELINTLGQEVLTQLQTKLFNDLLKIYTKDNYEDLKKQLLISYLKTLQEKILASDEKEEKLLSGSLTKISQASSQHPASESQHLEPKTTLKRLTESKQGVLEQLQKTQFMPRPPAKTGLQRQRPTTAKKIIDLSDAELMALPQKVDTVNILNAYQKKQEAEERKQKIIADLKTATDTLEQELQAILQSTERAHITLKEILNRNTLFGDIKNHLKQLQQQAEQAAKEQETRILQQQDIIQEERIGRTTLEMDLEKLTQELIEQTQLLYTQITNRDAISKMVLEKIDNLLAKATSTLQKQRAIEALQEKLLATGGQIQEEEENARAAIMLARKEQLLAQHNNEKSIHNLEEEEAGFRQQLESKFNEEYKQKHLDNLLEQKRLMITELTDKEQTLRQQQLAQEQLMREELNNRAQKLNEQQLGREQLQNRLSEASHQLTTRENKIGNAQTSTARAPYEYTLNRKYVKAMAQARLLEKQKEGNRVSQSKQPSQEQQDQANKHLLYLKAQNNQQVQITKRPNRFPGEAKKGPLGIFPTPITTKAKTDFSPGTYELDHHENHPSTRRKK